MLFKWFMDLNIEDAGWDHSTFSKNQDRLLKHEVADKFFAAVVEEARLKRYTSDEHFTVDGTLIEAWASIKSFRPRDGGDVGGSSDGRNPSVDFHREKRTNATHCSVTDPEARLAKKSRGQAAKLSYMGHVLMENRSGLIMDMDLTQATGTAECETALKLMRRLPGKKKRRTVGGDKLYDTEDFVKQTRGINITPHVAQNTSGRSSRIDGRTTTHSGYEVSQRVRKRVEEIFGWGKTVGGLRKLRYKGRDRNRQWVLMSGSAFNLVRMARIASEAG